MPTYEYQCVDCNVVFERIQKISEPPVNDCPSCGGHNVRRLLSAPAFHLKGSGWYKTDYAKTSGTSGGDSGGNAEPSAPGTEGEKKPAAETKPSSSETSAKPEKSTPSSTPSTE